MFRRRRSRWAGALAGAAGGVVASFVMNRFQGIWTVAEKQLAPEPAKAPAESGEDATVKTADSVSRNVLHHQLTRSEKKWAGPAVHYTFGGIVGGIYGALAQTAPVATLGGGAAYGSAVWLLADEFAVPATGLSEPPSKTPVRNHVKAWTSHLVYGVVTDLSRRLILKVFKK